MQNLEEYLEVRLPNIVLAWGKTKTTLLKVVYYALALLVFVYLHGWFNELMLGV